MSGILLANPIAFHPLFEPIEAFILSIPAGFLEACLVLLIFRISAEPVPSKNLFGSVMLINLLTVPLAGLVGALLLGASRIVMIAVAESVPFVLEPFLIRRSLRRLQRKGWIATEVSFRKIVLAATVANAVSFSAGLALFGMPEEPYRPPPQCAINLSNIRICIHLYRVEHDGKYPPDLPALVSVGLSPRRLHCPQSRSESPSYEMSPGPFPAEGTADAARTLLAWETEARHDGRRWVLFLDSRVESITEGEFQRLSAGISRAESAGR